MLTKIKPFYFILSALLIFALPRFAVAGVQEGLDAYLMEDYKSALRVFKPLAESGEPEAQNALGVMYFTGKGVPQDYKESYKWTRLSAEQGNATAQNHLGLMYFRGGQGTKKDVKEALKWFQLSAEQGYSEAQFNLGNMYSRGIGVLLDRVRAHMWFNLAGAGGNEKAPEHRDQEERLLTAVQVDEAQRMAREWMEKHRQK